MYIAIGICQPIAFGLPLLYRSATLSVAFSALYFAFPRCMLCQIPGCQIGYVVFNPGCSMSVASVPLAVEILLVVIFGVNLTNTLPRYASGLQLSCPRADFNWSCAGGFMLIANRLLFSFLGPCAVVCGCSAWMSLSCQLNCPGPGVGRVGSHTPDPAPLCLIPTGTMQLPVVDEDAFVLSGGLPYLL